MPGLIDTSTLELSPRKRQQNMAFHDPSELADVLSRDIPWETYMTARLITDKDLQLIRRYDKRAEDLQASLVDEVRHARCRSVPPGRRDVYCATVLRLC
jgi:hypothetical protein